MARKPKLSKNQMSFVDFFSQFVGNNSTNGNLAIKETEERKDDPQEPLNEEKRDLSMFNLFKTVIPKTDSVISTVEPEEIVEVLKDDTYYEVPEGAVNFRITEDVTGKGKLEKLKNNIEAIKTTKSLKGLATRAQQMVMSLFSGFGGLAEAFKENSKLSEELKEVLSDEEYTSARETTLTAFYTPKKVIDFIYGCLKHMGFTEGKVLEPSCGSGKFIGCIPEDMKCEVTAVEIDTLTGRIAKALYPQSNVLVKGFEDLNVPDNYYDVVVGNLPFGNFKVYDKEYDALYKKGFSIHEYFLAKCIDKVHPGGIVAIVLSTYFMDSINGTKRKYVADRAELLGAVRLSNNTFPETQTSADILFLKKRKEIIDSDAEFICTSRIGKNIEKSNKFDAGIYHRFYTATEFDSYFRSEVAVINDYYLLHPEHLAGNIIRVRSGRFGKSLSFLGENNLNIEETVPANAYEVWNGEIKQEEKIPNGVIPNTFYRFNGKLYFANGDVPELQKNVNEAIITDCMNLRSCLQKLLQAQKNRENVEEYRIELNRLYDMFVKKYGLITSRKVKKEFEKDYSYPILCGLETFDQNGNYIGKATIFSKQTTYVFKDQFEKETSPAKALIKSMKYYAKVNLDYMCQITGFDQGDIVNQLRGKIYINPETNQYETAEEYLSGNIRHKLEKAKAAAEKDEALLDNVDALSEVLPPDVLASDIEISLGTKWIPVDVYIDFAKEVIADGGNDGNIEIYYSSKTVSYDVRYNKYLPNESVNTRWGVHGADTCKNGYDLLKDCLQNIDTKIYKDGIKNGSSTRVLDANASKEAQVKQNEMRGAFQEWVTKSEERMERLAVIYNHKFNSYVTREYDGSFLDFPGMTTEVTLRTYQKNAIARILLHGNALIAHVVGAGKTYELIASAMEGKRMNLFDKPLMVVPKHLVAQWQSDWLKLYPGARILAASEKDFARKNRANFISRVAMNNYDGIIMSYEQFSNITLSDFLQASYIEQDIAEARDYLENLKTDSGDNMYSIKEVEKRIKTLESRLTAITDNVNRKKELIDFELLGIDKIYVDEAHYYKNLRINTQLSRIKGVQTTAALKTDRFYNIVRYMNETYNEKALTFATATPISNSMSELYTMMKYLEPSVLKSYGCEHFDEWATAFGKIESQLELDPNGSSFRTVQKFSKFYNLPELIVAFHQVADVKLKEDIEIEVPEAVNITCENNLSDFQEDFMNKLVERSEQIRSGGVDPSVDNMLLITNDGKKLSIDPRILDESVLVDDHSSKLGEICNNIAKEYSESMDIKGTQLVFLDCSTPNKDHWNMYDAIKNMLIGKGIPSEEIEYIHNADTKSKKEKLFKAVNDGEIRVLIGSTSKMGTGMNVQTRIVAIHHADVPWRPADIEQRNGRGIRNGNINNHVNIYRYITKGSFDARAWQTVEDKQKFIGALMHGHKNIGRSMDGDLFDEATLSYGEIKACALKDPRIKEYFELENEINTLRVNVTSEKMQVRTLNSKIHNLPAVIEQRKKYLENIHMLNAENTYEISDEFLCTVQDVTYESRVDAAEALGAALRKLPMDGSRTQIGNYRGFTLVASYHQWYFSIGIGKELNNGIFFSVDAKDNIYSSEVKYQVWNKIDNIFDSLNQLEKDAQDRLAASEENLTSAIAELEKHSGEFAYQNVYREKMMLFKRLGEELHMNEYINETASLDD